VTDPDVYRDLVADYPVDRDAFVAALGSSEMSAAAEQDFMEAQWLGVTGFPTLLLRDGTATVPLSLGFAPFEQVAERLNGLIAKNYPEIAAGLVCDLDGSC
jgi:protein-disulfide isomerase-like protein with CxxC motif